MEVKTSANYNRGAGWRGKKRPEHSAWLIKNHPMKGKHFSLKSRMKMSISVKDAHRKGLLKADNFRGHHHTEQAKQKMREKLLGRKRPEGVTEKILKTKMIKYGRLNFNNGNAYGRSKRGYYDINGKKIYFRSLWEANYALYLDFLMKRGDIKSWEFEADTFWFEKIKRGVRSYMPDFKVFLNDGSVCYHEVKGYLDQKSKTKLARMKRYYPEVKLILFDQQDYKQLSDRLGKLLKFF